MKVGRREARDEWGRDFEGEGNRVLVMLDSLLLAGLLSVGQGRILVRDRFGLSYLFRIVLNIALYYVI